MGVPEAMAAVGILASAAGTGVSMSAASKSRRDMDSEVRRNLATQELYKGQAQPIFNQSLNEAKVKPQQQLVAAGEQAAAQRYAQANALYGQQGVVPYDATRAAGQIAQASDAQSRAQGYQSAAMDNWLRNQWAQQQLGVIGNLASSTAGVAPILTQLAGQRSSALGAAGSLLSTAGGLAGMYGGLAGRGGGGQVTGNTSGSSSYGAAVKAINKKG